MNIFYNLKPSNLKDEILTVDSEAFRMELIHQMKQRVKIFSSSHFDDVKGRLRLCLSDSESKFEDSKVYDGEKEVNKSDVRQSQQCIVRKGEDHDDIFSTIKSLLEKELVDNVLKIFVEDNFTFVKYEEGGFFKKHTDFVKLRAEDCLEYHLILYLEKPTSGGETAIYVDDTKIITTNDVLFDKTLTHESLELKNGCKTVALFNVVIQYQQTDKILFSVPYNGTPVNFYNTEGDRELCYCVIEPKHSIVAVCSLGVLLDRSGKCCILNTWAGVVDNHEIYDKFETLCMDEILMRSRQWII
ncbi:IL-1 receptor antagonist [Yokapox virus]|uniref:IL-1 receptor antagonist n=1 Tax=Yokapox virus TaxID=1076255 RepID=G3EI78_9POXV|nr:IL-1 receptor antagonist [Yokapox virus]YP_004821539.1 IL-1 receptor antagonist [Yokapox virus]AEN03590.1 IL-1 receptor antagonist [Yokapox virus]AEN03775.1 IL-1 receptor antagonist [Yokapox virus]